jgi:hypothetical protein
VSAALVFKNWACPIGSSKEPVAVQRFSLTPSKSFCGVVARPGDPENQDRHAPVLLCVRHETANEIGDFIGGGIQGKVPRVKDVNMSLWNITAVRLGLRQLKR